jgi:purine-cytosine permease-like protein
MNEDIKELADLLEEKEKEGSGAVKIGFMIETLRKLYQRFGSQESDSDRLRVELKHKSDLESWKDNRETERLMINATITFGGLALRSAILVNGGAAVACLTFLGNVKGDYSLLANSLGLYVCGVLLAMMATGGAYICQAAYTLDKERLGDWLRIVCVILIFASYGMFGSGSFFAYDTFTHNSQPVDSINSVTPPSGSTS